MVLPVQRLASLTSLTARFISETSKALAGWIALRGSPIRPGRPTCRRTRRLLRHLLRLVRLQGALPALALCSNQGLGSSPHRQKRTPSYTPDIINVATLAATATTSPCRPPGHRTLLMLPPACLRERGPGPATRQFPPASLIPPHQRPPRQTSRMALRRAATALGGVLASLTLPSRLTTRS